LPPGWITQTDPNTGATFYVNTATNETTWTKPMAAPPGPPPPADAPPPTFQEGEGMPTEGGPPPSGGGMVTVQFMGQNRLGVSWDGTTVVGVAPASQAEQNGVQVGWQILSVDNDSFWNQNNRLSTRAQQPGSFPIVFNTALAPDMRKIPFRTGVGIGVDFNQTTGQVTVVKAGSQAQSLGVQAGWIMLAVDNQKWSNQALIQGSQNTAKPTTTLLFRVPSAAQVQPVVAPMVVQPVPVMVGAIPVAGVPNTGQGQGHYHQQRYCGVITVLIGIFIFPCVCCCPCDVRTVWVPTGQQPPPNEGCCD